MEIETAAAVDDATVLAVASAQAAFETYLAQGDHPEVQKFEGDLGGVAGIGTPTNVWDFIEHATEGRGGFADGSYLHPFRLELEGEGPGQPSRKYMDRRRQADYDGFPGHICGSPWDLIVSKSDLVKRDVKDPRLADWFQNVDGSGTTIQEFMEGPFRQARMFGVGLFAVDRPAVAMTNAAQDDHPDLRPYLFVIPTRNVRWWAFDERDEFLAIAYQDGDENVVVWTREGQATFAPIREKGQSKNPADWQLVAAAVNQLGVVPVVRVLNRKPDQGALGIGATEMLRVARLGQAVYNMESEAREIERLAASPVFVVPVKSASDYAQNPLVIGAESALVYDGEAGAPSWVQPSLDVLTQYEKRKAAKIESAYRVSDLLALYGNSGGGGVGGPVQTSSGYHAEVEFSKTERKVARLSGNTEAAERRAGTMVLAYMNGARLAGHLDLVELAKGVGITYPREFGIRDLAKLLERTKGELEVTQGDEGQRAILEEWFRAKWPRKSDKDIQVLVDSEMTKRASARARLEVFARDSAAKAIPPGGRPARPAAVPPVEGDTDQAAGGAPDPKAPKAAPNTDQAAAPVAKPEPLNGAQITAAVDLLKSMRAGIVGPVAARALLLGVGVNPAEVDAMVKETEAMPALAVETVEPAAGA